MLGLKRAFSALTMIALLGAAGVYAKEEIYSATDDSSVVEVMRGAPTSVRVNRPSKDMERVQARESAPSSWNKAQEKNLKKRAKRTSKPKKKKKKSSRVSSSEKELRRLRKKLAATRKELLEAELKLKRVGAAAEQAPPPRALQACIEPGKGNYDTVIPQGADSVAGRLAIVEDLILRHHRAYDYRIHTTSELRQILDELDRHGDALPPAPRRR